MKRNGIPEAWAAFMEPLTLRHTAYLWEYAEERRAAGETVLPPQELIFRALELTPPDNVRCVILGQDPYHTPGVANGLAFSANRGCQIPPSLRNIFKELSADIGCPMPTEPDLTPWAEAGVLLLNTILTVRAGTAGSHADWGWQNIAEDVLRACVKFPQPIMFLLWGKHAQKAAKWASFATSVRPDSPDNTKVLTPEQAEALEELYSRHPYKRVIYSSHPSPLGACRGTKTLPAFLGSRPFSRTNAFLRASGAAEIPWALP